MTDRASALTPAAIDIMLVSHTNVGKTTLVRTLLGQDVGDVDDAPDVTRAVVSYDLVTDKTLGALRLWDTPGFGDSFRLAKRLRRKYRWVAWIIREIWDRFQNPRLWRSQRVALDLRKRASVILYLVNSLERPADAIYVEPELQVLEWIGKPVLAILNQSGAPLSDQQENPRIAEWRSSLSGHSCINSTLSLDSFTRCWLQELILYDEIGRALPERSRESYQNLARIVRGGHLERFDASITAITGYLLGLARDKVELEAGSFGPLKDLWDWIRTKIPWGHPEKMQPHERAMETLTQRFMVATKELTDRLILINRLTGVSDGDVIEAAGEKFSIDGPVDESTSALAGGVISGALAGLGGDLLVGGLSLGAGALAGAVLGAVGAAALAKGYNIYSSRGKKVVGWSPDSLTEAFAKSLMLYLAIAHFGRGQGEWRRKEVPENWTKAVTEGIARYRESLVGMWARATTDGEPQEAKEECGEILRAVLEEVLLDLYPETRDYLAI